MSGWEWKDKSGATGGLLYEPGNWGDLIKGEWLLRTLRFLLGGCAGNGGAPVAGEFAYLDICAGMPFYPAGRPCAARVRQLPQTLLVRAAAAEYVRDGRWPCSAVIAADFFVQIRVRAALTVFDLDPGRREELRAYPAFGVADVADGYALLPPPVAPGLILADPYDFLAQWPQNLPAILQSAQHSPLLLYVYNRSGRGKERLREYARFRAQLRDAGVPVLAGRAAADAFLPECWHEMFFLPGPVAGGAGYAAFCAELAQATQTLDGAIRAAAVFEEF